MNHIRVRFAPSPTGPLHIGGIRTALYNYLFAKKHQGNFILRIEDTDQARYISKAEKYIVESLYWFGMIPDEGPGFDGNFSPYRQSERKDLYREKVLELIDNGQAYYAFDTSEELDQMRKSYEQKGVPSPKYDFHTRSTMKNSLTLSESETKKLLQKGENVTIRLLIPESQSIEFDDLIRGTVRFSTSELDDKILLKADGMPTYHLANVVDDHDMKISHVIRGEEWLSSTAHHVLLYRAFGWNQEMPKFAHLPLILKPTGKGKLSKRDGAKFGFPVFPIAWDDEDSGETFTGFREEGYLPEAILNFLSLLGWNPGTEQEIFSMDELIDEFSLDKIVKSGARFDIAKAKWFNQQYLIRKDDSQLAELAKPFMEKAGYHQSDDYLEEVCRLMKERIETIPEIFESGNFFFEKLQMEPHNIIHKKYNKVLKNHIVKAIAETRSDASFNPDTIESRIKSYCDENQVKPGDIMPLLRLAITGTLKGPGLFEIMSLLGRNEVLQRLDMALVFFDKLT